MELNKENLTDVILEFSIEHVKKCECFTDALYAASKLRSYSKMVYQFDMPELFMTLEEANVELHGGDFKQALVILERQMK